MAELPSVARYKNAVGSIDPKARALQPFEFAYCEWYAIASQTGRKNLEVRIAKMAEVAPEGFDAGRRYIERLHRSKIFKEYVTAIKKDSLAAARKKLKGLSLKIIQAHEAGLDMALAAEDYKAVPAFTNPIIDRISPKNNVADVVNAIQINISTTRQELIDEKPLEIEYDVIDDGTEEDDD